MGAWIIFTRSSRMRSSRSLEGTAEEGTAEEGAAEEGAKRAKGEEGINDADAGGYDCTRCAGGANGPATCGGNGGSKLTSAR